MNINILFINTYTITKAPGDTDFEDLNFLYFHDLGQYTIEVR